MCELSFLAAAISDWNRECERYCAYRQSEHTHFISGSEKLILFTARHAPKTARTFFPSVIACLDSGFDHETVCVYLKNSEADLKTTQREQIKQAFREAYKQTTFQGDDANKVRIIGVPDAGHLFLYQRRDCMLNAIEALL